MKRPILHSSYIKRWADQSGKTYRELEALWKRTFDEVNYDEMFEPSKYERIAGGDISQEVQRKFEETLTTGPEKEQEELDALMAVPAEEEFGLEAEADLDFGPESVPENEIVDELEDLFSPMELPEEEEGEDFIPEGFDENEEVDVDEEPEEDMFAEIDEFPEEEEKEEPKKKKKKKK